jgi:hypothetical protein
MALLVLPLRMEVRSQVLLARMSPAVTTALVLSAVQVMHFVFAMWVSVLTALPALPLRMVVKSRHLLARMLTVMSTAPV